MPTNDIIEKAVEEFKEKSNSDNFKIGECHALLGDHLLTQNWYPESAYELDKEKITDWLQTTLREVADQARKEAVRCGKVDEFTKGEPEVCQVKLDCHLHDWRQEDMKEEWQKEARMQEESRWMQQPANEHDRKIRVALLLDIKEKIANLCCEERLSKCSCMPEQHDFESSLLSTIEEILEAKIKE